MSPELLEATILHSLAGIDIQWPEVDLEGYIAVVVAAGQAPEVVREA